MTGSRYERETPVRVVYGGRTYNGSWRAMEGMVHVSSAYGSRSAEIGLFAPETRAAMVFEDLVHDWRPA